jgi:heme-degrading monooxygenase HmoA
MQPQVGQVVTVFRSRLRPGATDYDEHAGRMSALARTMPGYVDHKTFVAADGERVTVVTFADRDSHRAWRDNVEHRQAQRAGVEHYYDSYTIQVGVVDHAAAFTRDSSPSGA